MDDCHLQVSFVLVSLVTLFHVATTLAGRGDCDRNIIFKLVSLQRETSKVVWTKTTFNTEMQD